MLLLDVLDVRAMARMVLSDDLPKLRQGRPQIFLADLLQHSGVIEPTPWSPAGFEQDLLRGARAIGIRRP